MRQAPARQHPHRHARQALVPTRIAALLASSAFCALLAAPARAQDAAPAADTAAKDDVVGLDKVVVTASSQKKSKMRSSVSVTDVDQDQVKDFGAHTEAEVLLLIPGIRANPTAGPGGNSNITVRGLPIASGGSKYVQLQEDGLPTVQFGDMNFSNNDYWIRFDNNVESIQTLRGGSSSVFASDAPGAVINYISKTGKTTGGSIGLTRGLNYNETRLDADYGGRIAPDLRYHIGGYARQGEGPRDTSGSELHGYQLKGNLTKEFNDGKGYLRASFKLLDEQAPTYTAFPMVARISGNTVTGFSRLPNFDAGRDSQYSAFNTSLPGLNPVTGKAQTSSLNDGISVNSKSVGLEFHNELASGFAVDDKFRYSNNSGSFQTQFWTPNSLSGMLAGFGAGTTAVYANGPKAGQTVTQANLSTGLVSNDAAINTQTPDMGNLVNDLSVSRLFKLDGVNVDTRLGYFHSRQNVVQTWSVSNRTMELGRDGGLINVFDSTGAALTTAGLSGYNNQWGACCARDIDAHFTTDAPYLSLGLSSGNWDIDSGLRHDYFKSNARYAGPVQVPGGVDVNGDGLINGAEKIVYVADEAHPGFSDYKTGYSSYSLGANYKLNNDLSGFMRYSKGGRAIADRLLFSANIDAATGQLAPGGSAAAVAIVKQSEAGLKYRGSRDWGNYGLFATLFHSTTNEFDYDQTRVIGPKLNVVGYRANGVELESAITVGNFAINFNAVYTDLVVTSDLVGQASGASTVGKTPGGTPKWQYTISPKYAFGNASLGATVRGQSKVWGTNDDTFQIDGHYIVNAFANYDFGNGVVLALNVGNVFNKIWAAGGSGQGSIAEIQRLGAAAGVGGVMSGDAELGRTASVSLRYDF